jgi:hypothetical protein
VLQEQDQTSPPFVPGFFERQQEQPPAEGAAEQPPCPEGQVLDEETGICVLEESDAPEESEQPESEDGGTEEEESSNN